MIAYLYWNPDSAIFTLPYLHHPVTWYGLCFMTGFLLGFLLILKPLSAYSETPQKLADRLLWFVLIGTIVGARLGHILFYEPAAYLAHPLSMLKIWEGGLASHGGTMGVILATLAFRLSIRKSIPELTLLQTLDIIAPPTALVAFFIRLGNFFNQEIIGTPTTVPWAIIFGEPFDQSIVAPRHPSMLYEGLAYLATFFLLRWIQKRTSKPWPPGKLTGLFLVLVFISRFFIEFTKELQPSFLNQSFLQAGQWLSLPFIALGFFLLLKK